MSKYTSINETLYQYILDNWLRESPLLGELRAETEQRIERSQMQIAPDQGQLMAFLIRLIGTKKIIEIGTFTGYSALVMAQALPPEGKVVCLDISTEWTDIAKKYWKKAGVMEKIDLYVAPALETLSSLLPQEESTFDMAFIDADKANYDAYYERCLKLLKTGGIIMLDNVFWNASVCDNNDQSEDTVAIRALNKKLQADNRVELAIIPIGDGLTIAKKL